ncbi:MAG: hypothetical protein NVSMB31_01310 [Vulcanimicrobiaceae bacterium]
MNALVTNKAMVSEFRSRVEARDWTRAARLARVLNLRALVPQKIFEHDEVYFRRAARKIVSRRTSRQRPSSPAGGVAA